MEILRSLRRYWRDWRGSTLDDDIADELRFHLEMIADEESRQGARPEDAATHARRRFGRLDALHDECRHIHGIGTIDMLKQDLSFGYRTLRRAPAFTLSALLTLALGIGAGTAGFSIVHSVVLEPLPYPDAERLVTAWQTTATGERRQVSAANWQDWVSEATTLEQLAAYSRWNFAIMGDPEAIRADGAIVLGPFFDTLGVRPALGRTFTAGDHSGADGEVLVISDRLWRSRFGADPGVIGRAVRVGAGSLRIVGVMPAGFAYPAATTDVWAPLSTSPAILGNRASEWLRTVGRLRPGVSVEQARAELASIAWQLAIAHPDTNRGESASLDTLHAEIVREIRPTLLLLLAAGLVLFLTGCVNVGALQLSRGEARRREWAIRAALGAGTLRMVRQLVTESAILVAGGCLCGTLLAYAFVRLAAAAAPAHIPRVDSLGLQPAALLFAAAAGLVAVLVFGALGFARVTRPEIRDDLVEGAPGHTASRGVMARQRALVVAQVAFALALLVGAGLLFRSFTALTSVDPGFDPDVMTVRVALPRSQYQTDAQQAAFFGSIVERIRAIPGVTAAGAITDLPLVGNNVSFRIIPRGSEALPEADRPLAAVRAITPEYLDAMKIHVRAGRGIEPADDSRAMPVALVNRTLASRQWSGQALGQQLRLDDEARWLTIVGVVDDVRQLDLAEDEGSAIYVPLAQKQMPFLNWMTLVARGQNPTLAADMRLAVRSVDPDQPAFDAMTMEQRVSTSVATPRAVTGVLVGLATAAAALAIVGVYGMMTFVAGQRRREIGVRLALGATRRDIVGLILRSASTPVGYGLLIGLIAAMVVAKTMGTMLFGVTPFDIPTYSIAVAVFGLAAFVASYVPARRAAKTDPLHVVKTV